MHKATVEGQEICHCSNFACTWADVQTDSDKIWWEMCIKSNWIRGFLLLPGVCDELFGPFPPFIALRKGTRLLDLLPRKTHIADYEGEPRKEAGR